MYDPKQEPHEFVGEDRAAAVEKAVAFFGLDAEQLEVKEFPAGDVYGLGGRAAVIAYPRDRQPPARRESRDGGDRGRGGRDRDRGRDRDSRGGRDREGRGGRGGREARGGRDRDRDRPPREAPVLSGEPSVGTAVGDLGDIGQFVLGVIERLDVGPFEIRENRDDEVTGVEVKGEAARVLSAGEARSVDALQLLANQVLSKEEDAGRVVLDVEGGSESREQHLERLVERVVERAIDGGKAIALDAMNSRDRRIVHITVRELEGVATMSMGQGRYRQVVIVPEGAPEYEEAVRQSESPDS